MTLYQALDVEENIIAIALTMAKTPLGRLVALVGKCSEAQCPDESWFYTWTTRSLICLLDASFHWINLLLLSQETVLASLTTE